MLREREGAVSIRELGELTAIKTDDIISTLQFLALIQYQKGQHVLCAAPDVLERHLRSAGSPGLEVCGGAAPRAIGFRVVVGPAFACLPAAYRASPGRRDARFAAEGPQRPG